MNTKYTASRRYITIKSVLKTVIYLVIALISFLIVSYTAFRVIYIPTEVVGVSMSPTLNSGDGNDTVYVNKFSYGDVGDIIVAETDWGGSTKAVIKRIVASGGDRVKFYLKGDSVCLYINHSDMVEDYVVYDDSLDSYNQWCAFLSSPYNVDYEFDGDGCLIIPDDYVYILGDNRDSSTDSSLYGPIPISSIIGRVDIVIPAEESSEYDIFNIIFYIYNRD